MACDCREKVEKMIRDKVGDPLAKIRGVIVFKEGSVQFMPTVAILYRKKKKDGTYSKNESEMELSYGYCPFCGKKLYDDEKENS